MFAMVELINEPSNDRYNDFTLSSYKLIYIILAVDSYYYGWSIPKFIFFVLLDVSPKLLTPDLILSIYAFVYAFLTVFTVVLFYIVFFLKSICGLTFGTYLVFEYLLEGSAEVIDGVFLSIL